MPRAKIIAQIDAFTHTVASNAIEKFAPLIGLLLAAVLRRTCDPDSSPMDFPALFFQIM